MKTNLLKNNKFIFTPICGIEEAKRRLGIGENPYGEHRPKRECFDTYWLYQGYELQWFWWQIELCLNKNQQG